MVQPTTKISTNLIWETANKTPTGMLLQATVELLRSEIGLSSIFKDIPWNKLKNALMSRWLTDLTYFLGEDEILFHDPFT